jgi:hypothetical protein
MKRMKIILLVFGLFSSDLVAKTKEEPTTFLMRPELLIENKEKIKNQDPDLTEALADVINLANATLKKGPYSVTYKRNIPPSGDKHDYLSVGPYWWPDTTKADGLPYIRRDGVVNPDRYVIGDADNLKSLISDVQLLAVTYFYTNEEKYAEHAAMLLRTWFIDNETRMNPNLNYGQAIPGITEGRGIGLIDTRGMVPMLDAIQLLKTSTSWTVEDDNKLKGWFKQFIHWMKNSPIGKVEEDEHNNHGTYYDYQIIGYALYVGDRDLAKKTIEQSTVNRIKSQFDVDGRQPHELARTLSWGYSLMNLSGFFGIARLAENVGIDLWNYQTDDKKNIKKAYEWLESYAYSDKEWRFKQIHEMDRSSFDPLYIIGSKVYGKSPVALKRKYNLSNLFNLTGSL